MDLLQLLLFAYLFYLSFFFFFLTTGTIDRQELRDGFAALGLTVSRQQTFNIMEAMNVDEDKDTLTYDEFSTAIRQWGRVLVSNQDVRTGRTSRALSLQPSASPRKARDESPIVTDDDNASIDMDVRSNKDDSKEKTPSAEQQDKDQSPEKSKSPVGTGGNIQGGGSGSTQSDPLLKSSHRSYQTEISAVPEHDGVDMTNDKQALLSSMWQELEDEEEEEEDLLLEMSNVQLLGVAMAQLLIGTILVTIFSDPMVDVINNFSDTINISAFFVSFVVTPVASNASEIYSALVFAAKRSTEGISLGFSALYGAACMNNTFVLCIFCAIVYFRKLEWTFLVETLVILLTIMIVGILGLSKTVEYVICFGNPFFLVFVCRVVLGFVSNLFCFRLMC